MIREQDIVSFVRETYNTKDFIPLHAPTFSGNEQKYVLDTLETTMVSSVGEYVNQFEREIASFTGTTGAVAVVNGTAALKVAMLAAGVQEHSLVITQALTFVATCNAIQQLKAEPIFVDVDRSTLGLCPKALENYLEENAVVEQQACFHKLSKRKISAVVPMHTFGHPVEMDSLLDVCSRWCIPVVEDAAESLGSYYKGQHTGTFGDLGAISFNGNKIITTGGGGMILTSDSNKAKWVKHVTTTAKVPHAFEFFHDEFGFNYRLPNLNAALGCGQLERLETIITAKRKLAAHYQNFFKDSDFRFVEEPANSRSNYWLNAVLCESLEKRNDLLRETNAQGVMTRPIWTLMTKLPMFKDSLHGPLENSEYLESCIVNLPSSPV